MECEKLLILLLRALAKLGIKSNGLSITILLKFCFVTSIFKKSKPKTTFQGVCHVIS